MLVSMSFLEQAQQLMQEGVLGVGFLVGEDGSIYWSTQNWDINPNEPIQMWQQGVSPMVVGGIKFSVLQRTDERMVATSLQGQGHLFIIKCPNYPAYMVAYSAASNQRDVAFSQIARVAGAVTG